MGNSSRTNFGTEAEKKAADRKSLIFGAVATIVMVGIELYGEHLNGEDEVPANAAEH